MINKNWHFLRILIPMLFLSCFSFTATKRASVINCKQLSNCGSRGRVRLYKLFVMANGEVSKSISKIENGGLMKSDMISNKNSSISVSNLSNSTVVEGNKPRRSDPFRSIPDLFILTCKIAFLRVELLLLSIRRKIFGPTEKSRKSSSQFRKGLNKFLYLITRRGFVIRALTAITLILLGEWYMSSVKARTTELPFSTFLQMVASSPDRISGLRLTESLYTFALDGRRAITRPVPVDSYLVSLFASSGVAFAAGTSPTNIVGLITALIYVGFMWNAINRMQQGPGDGQVGKSRDQLMIDPSLTFDAVAGQEAAKRDVMEVVDMLRSPGTYRAVGARPPSGVLLCGPPGTGKTLLARATAAEARVPFFSVSASEFVEVFVGRGAARVRQLFKRAAAEAPCIVFIDELDSIGRSRRLGSMNSEQENTLNQLLTCMDGLDTNNNGVIVMAATNRLELLDSALLRSGRFDRCVQCPLPDKNGRMAILKVHSKNLNMTNDVDLERIARFTAGTCGADLAAIANEAAIRTARRQGVVVSAADWEDALRTFLSSRGMSLAALTEAGLSTLPNWMRGLAGDNPVMSAS